MGQTGRVNERDKCASQADDDSFSADASSPEDDAGAPDGGWALQPANEEPMHDIALLDSSSPGNDVLAVENFRHALSAQVDISQRLQVACAMLVVQLEYEELFEELYGLDGARRIRRFFAHAVANNVRATDTVGWLEDGSVGVVLRVVTPDETGAVAERLQREIAHFPVLVGHANVHLAIRVGGVWYSGQKPMNPSDLTQQAYDALPPDG